MPGLWSEPEPGQSSGALSPVSLLLCHPQVLAYKGVAWPTAGTGDTWWAGGWAGSAGIGDAGPDGLAARIGCGTGVAR